MFDFAGWLIASIIIIIIFVRSPPICVSQYLISQHQILDKRVSHRMQSLVPDRWQYEKREEYALIIYNLYRIARGHFFTCLSESIPFYLCHSINYLRIRSTHTLNSISSGNSFSPYSD